jgi:hypothetical protein
MTEELKDENENSGKNGSTDENNSGEENKDKNKTEDDFQRNVEGEEKPSKKSDDVVPLKKYLDKKLKIKDLEKENSELKDKLQSGNSLNNKDLDDLAKELNADPVALKKLAQFLSPKQNADLEKKIADLEESNKHLLAKDRQRDAEKLFERNFKAKYGDNPELKEKKSVFKKIWFSPAFPELRTLEDIRKELFPHIKVAGKANVKKESLEEGSGGTNKGTKTIDFKNATDDQLIEVLKDPELKKKYYDYLDSQS